MGDWSLLKTLLDKVQKHSTVVGKVWLSVLFIFRILILSLAGESVWGDEKSGFQCNTAQPGCTNVCYDQAFPISHIRYWVLQFLFVSMPTLVYLGHVFYQSQHKDQPQPKEGEFNQLPSRNPHMELFLVGMNPKMATTSKAQEKEEHRQIQGPLMVTYVASVVCKTILEAGFLYGQWRLYGWAMEPMFICERAPCPYLVECYVSRPTEKTIFIIFMLVVGIISLVLNLLELVHLLCRCQFKGIWSSQNQKEFLLQGVPSDIGNAQFPCFPLSNECLSPTSSEQNWDNQTIEEKAVFATAPLLSDSTFPSNQKLPSRLSSSASKKEFV